MREAETAAASAADRTDCYQGSEDGGGGEFAAFIWGNKPSAEEGEGGREHGKEFNKAVSTRVVVEKYKELINKTGIMLSLKF